MARSLHFVLSEITRVAALVGCDSRSLARDDLLSRSEVTRHDLDSLGPYTKLRQDAAHTIGEAPSIDVVAARGVELRTSYVRGLERRASESDYFLERLEEATIRLFERAPLVVAAPRSRQERAQKEIFSRELVAVISDTHFGLEIDSREVPGNRFDWTIAARRLAKVAFQIATWKPQHRKETSLTICLAGDIIQGVIHAESDLNVTPMSEQIHGASQMLVQMIDYLSQHFDCIRVVCTPGNHDRFTHRSGRAVSGKWDGFAAQIYGILTFAFRMHDAIEIIIPRTPYVTFELVGGALVFVTHSDTVLRSGNLRRLNVEKITEQIHRLDASHTFEKPIAVTVVGHTHIALWTQLDNGTDLIANGCLSGADPFAQSLGFHASHPAQMIFEATPEHPVGDVRRVRLRDADQDASYDEIISPPSLAFDRAT